MDGAGSRLGRASSRYGPATTVFNGPVRKWKKKWVHVYSSSTVSYQNPHSQSNGQNSTTTSSSNNGGSHLLLCRWTPIPPTTTLSSSADDGGSVNGSGSTPDEPPKRKFRYTPIAVLEEQKKVAEKKVEDEEKTSETEQYGGAKTTTTTTTSTSSDEMLAKPDFNEVLKNETEVSEKNGSQDSNTSNLDLGLGLKGQDNLDSPNQSKETQMTTANSTGFWSVG
uniref:uncharacterized protein LOC107403624 n=1 Tax=Ziziphus jujuba TaxID=326968 RepID=A0A6P3YQP1_ZIZJJ